MTTEQMAVAGTEQTPGGSEQPGAVAAPTTGAVADAAERAVADFDLSTPEAVRAAAEKFPALKAVFSEFENTGRQRAQAELRRMDGSKERAKAYHAELVRRLAMGEDPNKLAAEEPQFIAANENTVRAELMRSLVQKSAELDPEAGTPLAELMEALDGDPEKLGQVAQAALNANGSKSAKLARQELLDAEDIDALPKDSKIRMAIDAYITKQLETEVNARMNETTKVPAGPQVPTGQATSPLTKEVLDGMSSEQRLNYFRTLDRGGLDAAWEAATQGLPVH